MLVEFLLVQFLKVPSHILKVPLMSEFLGSSGNSLWTPWHSLSSPFLCLPLCSALSLGFSLFPSLSHLPPLSPYFGDSSPEIISKHTWIKKVLEIPNQKIIPLHHVRCPWMKFCCHSNWNCIYFGFKCSVVLLDSSFYSFFVYLLSDPLRLPVYNFISLCKPLVSFLSSSLSESSYASCFTRIEAIREGLP